VDAGVVPVAHLDGELARLNSDDILSALGGHVDGIAVVIDLTQVTFLDSAFITDSCASPVTIPSVSSPPPAATPARLLDLPGIDHLVPTYETVARSASTRNSAAAPTWSASSRTATP
jgi:hypothetical protein